MTNNSLRLIQKEFDLEHHCGYRIAGEFVFSCQKKRHAYHCEQPFDFCPSCGMNLKKQKGENV